MAEPHIKMDSGNKLLMILSILALTAVLIFFLYHALGLVGQMRLTGQDPAPPDSVLQRIAPVGHVVAARQDATPAPAAVRTGDQVYQAACAACHDAGVTGAPRTADAGNWAQRLEEKGLETLVVHAIQGFKGMPARGGNPNLSDAEVRAAVEHILVALDLPLAGAAEAASAPAPAPAAAPPAEAATQVAVEPATEAEPVTLAEAPSVSPVPAPARGDAEAGSRLYLPCMSCHGVAGQGQAIFPRIAGQTTDYLVDRLTRYRAGEAVGPNAALMIPHAAALNDTAIADLAAYIATFP